MDVGKDKINMPQIIDLIGQTFGRLEVISFSHLKNGNSFWLCRCNCENHTEKLITSCNLRNGHTQSCGCYKLERISETHFQS